MASHHSAEAMADELHRQLSGLQSRNTELQHSTASLRSGSGDVPHDKPQQAPQAPQTAHKEPTDAERHPVEDAHQWEELADEQPAKTKKEESPQNEAHQSEEFDEPEERRSSHVKQPHPAATPTRAEGRDYPTEYRAPAVVAPVSPDHQSLPRDTPPPITQPPTAYEHRDLIQSPCRSSPRGSILSRKSSNERVPVANMTTFHTEEEFAPDIHGKPLSAFERRTSSQSAPLSLMHAEHTPKAATPAVPSPQPPAHQKQENPHNDYPAESPRSPPAQHTTTPPPTPHHTEPKHEEEDFEATQSEPAPLAVHHPVEGAHQGGEPEDEPAHEEAPVLTVQDVEEPSTYPVEDSAANSPHTAASARSFRGGCEGAVGAMEDMPFLSSGSVADDGEERSPDLWVNHKAEGPSQCRLSNRGRNPVITSTDLFGVPVSGDAGGARMRSILDRHRGLQGHRTRPHKAEEGYVSLYADRFSSNSNDRSVLVATQPLSKSVNVDVQLADFLATSLLPALHHVTGQQQVGMRRATLEASGTVPQLQPARGGRPAMSLAATAVMPAKSQTVAAADDQSPLPTVAARFKLMSAENGDVVERDALAGLGYWDAANPRTTQYTKPSALLEAKEDRECTLFRRYSRNYEKLVTDTAGSIGGDAGASVQNSYKNFQAACEARDRKPIHKRSFYAGEPVDWKKLLLEQQSGMSNAARRTA